MSSKCLSIILSTWNNSQRLAITLDAIARCTIPAGLQWELVLVNNNCTDDTDAVAQAFATRLPLVYVHEPRQGLSRARNAGLRAAAGQLILFTDDDVRPYPEWIATYWAAFQSKPQGYYFGGPIESEFESIRPDPELLPYAPGSVKGLDWGREARMLELGETLFVSANWACPADALRAVGRFDERLGLDPSSHRLKVGEESDLMQRLQAMGLKPWYLPEARIRHFVPARKCKLRHIAARREASGYMWARYRPDHDLPQVPDWMYKVAVKLWWRWLKERLRGRKAYQEYMEYRTMVGRIKGLRDRIRAQEVSGVAKQGEGVRHAQG